MIFSGATKAKAGCQVSIDAEVRKHGEQSGLDTHVVHAVNNERCRLALHETIIKNSLEVYLVNRRR